MIALAAAAYGMAVTIEGALGVVSGGIIGGKWGTKGA